ncbi:MAG: SDR family NAD(P)-dependent oxidoreductase [Rhodobacteraceae bacterium]|nr:SDR family NAD(P)-dependent oxidoreductase [Paracoccaceae bacterium]
MRDFKGKRYWLVGASEGLGAALASKLAADGAELILSARSEERLAALAADLPGTHQILPVDIGDDASVATAGAKLGDVDGVVLLAGVYWPMKAQDWDADQATRMADINFTGFLRALGQVMPGFAARGSGHVVITGSLSGFRGLPGAIGYAASKAGTMVLAESMYADLKGSGIDVQLANPGFIRTRLTDKNDFTMPFIMEPDAAADIMLRHMKSNRFKISFPYGFSLVFRLSQFMPDWLYYRLFA